ncbi:hypothetical protein GJ496_010705 [Pomphorhynchus laevis]|nr:hypothetical protein GJ496_010705 [Pomphorhynchus laevis]
MKLQSALFQIEISINKIISDMDVKHRRNSGSTSSFDQPVCHTSVNELTNSKRLINKYERNLLTNVFDDRARDVVGNIRQLCLEELGHWFTINLDKFSKKKFFIYLGDFLYDKSNDNILQCLKVLSSFLKSNYSNVVLSVMSICKIRVQQLICHKDAAIASDIINICSEMLRRGKNVVEESKFIHYSLFAMDSKRAYAAGQFFIIELLQRAELLNMNSNDCNYLKLCATQFCQLGINDYIAYFVDSIFSYHPMFTNLNAMMELVLHGSSCWNDATWIQGLFEEHDLHLSLMRIITCSIHRAVTGNSPGERNNQQINSTTFPQNRVKSTVDICNQFTRFFTSSISEIMSKYLSEDRQIGELLTLIPLMNASEFQECITLDQFNLVLDKCIDLSTSSGNLEVLSKVSAALEWFSNSQIKHCDHATAAVNNFMDVLTVDFSRYLKLMKAGEFSSNDNVQQYFTGALIKITIFHRNHNYTKYAFWRKLIRLMETNSNIEILTYCLELSKLRIFWAVRTCANLINFDSDNENTKMCCSRIFDRAKQLCVVCFQLMANYPNETICLLAYTTICQMLCCFNAELDGNGTSKIALFDIRIRANSPVMNLIEYTEKAILSDHMSVVQRRECVVSFVKLILNRVIPLKCYATILKHYVQVNTYFGDILRSSITMLREKNPGNDVAKLLGRALCEKDKDVRSNVDENYINFEIKELTKQMKMLLAYDRMKRHEEIVIFHSVCLRYAIMNHRSRLFNIISEFIEKLSEADKDDIYKVVSGYNSTVDNNPSEFPEPLVSTIDIIRHDVNETLQHKQISLDTTIIPAEISSIDIIDNTMTSTSLNESRINIPLMSSTKKMTQRQMTISSLITDSDSKKQFTLNPIDEEE